MTAKKTGNRQCCRRVAIFYLLDNGLCTRILTAAYTQQVHIKTAEMFIFPYKFFILRQIQYIAVAISVVTEINVNKQNVSRTSMHWVPPVGRRTTIFS